MFAVKNHLKAASSAIALAGVLLPGAVQAQETASAGATEHFIGEIVVTARHRVENLQDVPMAITAFSEAELEKSGTAGLADLAAMTPGLSFQDTNGAFQSPVIRGIAQVDQMGPQGNVGVFIDGVYLNNRSGLEFGLMDVARIEVVKGPQSALYGRNTFAGAINYVSAEPDLRYLSGKVLGEIGNYGRRKVTGSLNLPVSDMLAVRVFGGYATFDGTIDNLRTGKHIGGYDHRYSFGGSVLFQPTDAFSLKLFAMHSDQDNHQGPLVSIPTTENNCGSQVTRNGVPYYTLFCGKLPTTSVVDMDTVHGHGLKGDSDLMYAVAKYEFDTMTLSGMVSHTKAGFSSSIDTTADPDAVNVPNFGGLSRQQYTNAVGDSSKETSADLRLASSDNGRLTWTTGVYYFNSEISDILQLAAVPYGQPDAAPVPFVERGGRLKTEGWAVYGSVGYEFTDRFDAQLELRYNNEKQKFAGRGSDAAAVGEQDYEYLTPRLILNYDVTDDVMVYASAARGYKTGGFNSNAYGVDGFMYGEETNWSYELGVKSSLFDRKLLLNVAGFYIDWKDLQSQANIASSSLVVVQNNGGARSYGIEADATYYFTRDLWLRAAGTVLDPTYKNSVRDGDVAAPCGDIPGSLIEVKGCSYAVGGNQMARTSDFQMAISGGYTHRDLFEGVDGYLRADYSYQSSKYSTSLNLQEQGSIELVNVRAGLTFGRADVSLWVKNLFDSKYNARATVVGSVADGSPLSGITYTRIYPGERRTWGLTASYRF